MRKKKFKKIFVVVLIGLLILMLGLSFFFINEKRRELVVIFNDKMMVEVNSEMMLDGLIKELKNGKLKQNVVIDTSVVGKKQVQLVIEDMKKKSYKYDAEIEIVDLEKPEMEFSDTIVIIEGDEVDLVKDVVVRDNSKEDIKVEVDGVYNVNEVGTYELFYVATDSSGNEARGDFKLIVKEKVVYQEQKQENKITVSKTSKGYVIEVRDGVTYVDGILIANKTYALPSWYGNGLLGYVTDAFNVMKADASNLGLNLYISSGFRSYADQKYIYNNYVAVDGQDVADTYSARAGHSEHQSGLAFDLNSINDSFTQTEEGKWVNSNCYKYGFIIRYPYGKDNITGYMHESWHLRYVGVELASKLYNNGDWITLEEYLGIDSKYR